MPSSSRTCSALSFSGTDRILFDFEFEAGMRQTRSARLICDQVAFSASFRREPERWRALGDGYRVGVRIVTLALDDVVKVPVSAVFPVPQSADGGSRGMAAFVVDNGRARLTGIRVGARNGSEAWVHDGLAPGTSVIVYPPTQLRDGARVKVRPG